LDGAVQPPEVDEPGDTVTGAIADIRSAVINGNTTYYIRLEGSALYYAIAAAKSQGVVLLNKGDTVRIAVLTPATSSAAIYEAGDVMKIED